MFNPRLDLDALFRRCSEILLRARLCVWMCVFPPRRARRSVNYQHNVRVKNSFFFFHFYLFFPQPLFPMTAVALSNVIIVFMMNEDVIAFTMNFIRLMQLQ